MKRALLLVLLPACSPLSVADEVNAAVGRQVVTFRPECTNDRLRDGDLRCVRLEWDTLKPGQLGRTEPPYAGGPWVVTISETIRDNLPMARAVLAHELGHVLGFPDDPVSGRLMSRHLTPDADRLLSDLRSASLSTSQEQ
jgi:hypothetical protein